MSLQPTSRQRETAAFLDAEVRRCGGIVLRGANPVFSDIVISAFEAGSLRILGRCAGLIRSEGGRA